MAANQQLQLKRPRPEANSLRPLPCLVGANKKLITAGIRGI